ncbi:MAG: T9SS type A sorting domain-containing protein [Saprospiraceae bacterium]
MRTIRYLLVLSIISLSFLCRGQYILTLHCSQMDAYIGKSFNVRVTERESGWEVGRKTITPIDTADFSLDLYVLLAPHSYNVDFYVDVNDNGAYDAPLTDHTWRRVLITPDKDTIVNFHPGETFTDITFPNVFPYSTYNATWGGKWRNLTFGTTDSIEAGFNVRCDSILGFFKTKGVFGNPAPVEYTSSNPRPSNNTIIPDTLHYAVIPPWSGDIYFTNGDLYGDLALATLGFHFRGTVGEKQMLGLYTITNSGTQLANGYFYVRELHVISSTGKLVIDTGDKSDISCNGSNDGFISLSVSGGTPEYNYLWADSMTTPMITALSPGTYSVTVTDSGCSTAEANFEITEPEPLEVGLDFLTEVSCNGSNDGSISISGEGGTPGYAYLWSNSLMTADISSLAAGTYGVTITDSNGCSATAGFDITEPELLAVQAIMTNVSCYGECDGIIDLNVSGGRPGYSFIWNTGNASEDLVDLCDGIYSVTIADENGCTTEYSVIILSPAQIIIDSIQVIDEVNSQSNGQIIVGSAIIPNALYSINNGPYQLLNIFIGLPAGVYIVSIKLQNGCTLETEVEIQNIIIEKVNELDIHFSFYPNPASTEIYLQSDIPVSVEMLDVTGHVLMESPISIQHTLQVENLVSGLYVLRISDGYGTSYRKVIVK